MNPTKMIVPQALCICNLPRTENINSKSKNKLKGTKSLKIFWTYQSHTKWRPLVNDTCRSLHSSGNSLSLQIPAPHLQTTLREMEILEPHASTMHRLNDAWSREGSATDTSLWLQANFLGVGGFLPCRVQNLRSPATSPCTFLCFSFCFLY